MSQTDFDHIDPLLRNDVRHLGKLLGAVIALDQGADDQGAEEEGAGAQGPAALEAIERVRALAKEARGQGAGTPADWQALSQFLEGKSDKELVTIARAFNQFLNLANIAEQAHAARNPAPTLTLRASSDPDASADALKNAVAALSIELVLTAHPTEVLRRTMIQKYDAIEDSLRRQTTPAEQQTLERLVAESWYNKTHATGRSEVGLRRHRKLPVGCPTRCRSGIGRRPR